MTKHLLVDLENVRPSAAAVADWMGAEGKAWIFYGPHQHKSLPSFRAMGDDVTLIPISRPGANSLDFHLIFYLGYLAAGNPKSEFKVLTKDTGYDPAIEHARILEFDVKRIDALSLAGAARGLSTDGASKAAKPAAKPAKRPPAAKKSAPGNKPPAKGVAPATNKKVAPKPARAAKAKVETTPAGPTASGQTKALAKAPKSVNGPCAKTTPVKKSASKLVIAIYRDVLADLRGPNRPRNLTALERHIQSRIGAEPATEKVRAIVDRLKTVDAIRVVGNRLVYFPEEVIARD